MDGISFIDTLSSDDFQIFENGSPQSIDALYLVKNAKILRREERARVGFEPQTERHHYLYFDVSEFTEQLEKAVDVFINHILGPGDHLTLLTPTKTYRMKDRTLEILPTKELIEQVQSILKTDILSGQAEYKNLTQVIENSARSLSRLLSGPEKLDVYASISGEESLSVDSLVTRYASLLQLLENLRKVNQEKISKLTQALKKQNGQKNVFFFYQRDTIPLIQPDAADRLSEYYADSPGIRYNLSYLYDYLDRDLSLDVEGMRRAFADSSAAVHFLFFSEPISPAAGFWRIGTQEDSIELLSDMALSTGGSAARMNDPELFLKEADRMSRDYYLLYYRPKVPDPDGTFKTIEVKAKNGDYKITHREGYFAR